MPAVATRNATVVQSLTRMHKTDSATYTNPVRKRTCKSVAFFSFSGVFS